MSDWFVYSELQVLIRLKLSLYRALWYIVFLYCNFHYTELMFLYCAWRCSCTNRLMLVSSYKNQHAFKLEHFLFSDQHNGLCGNSRYVYNLELVMSFFSSDWCGSWVLSNSGFYSLSFFLFFFPSYMLLISIESALGNIFHIWHQLKKFEVKEFLHLVI
jgi:hypothetical protein